MILLYQVGGGWTRMILSERALDHVSRPRNRGEMADANQMGVAGSPGDGPYVQIWLKVEEGKILKASYETNGCPSSIACASALCELAIGREMEKMRLLEPNDLIAFLGGLPEGKEMYASLTVKAIQNMVGRSF